MYDLKKNRPSGGFSLTFEGFFGRMGVWLRGNSSAD